MIYYLMEYHLIIMDLVMHHLPTTSMLCAQGPILQAVYELINEISETEFTFLILQYDFNDLVIKVSMSRELNSHSKCTFLSYWIIIIHVITPRVFARWIWVRKPFVKWVPGALVLNLEYNVFNKPPFTETVTQLPCVVSCHSRFVFIYVIYIILLHHVIICFI